MGGEKKPVTLRMPSDMKTALEAISKERGWNLTDLLLIVLDQFIQFDDYKKRTKKG